VRLPNLAPQGGSSYLFSVGLTTFLGARGAVVEKDEDSYYVASAPELPGYHTKAKTLDELIEKLREVIEACLSVVGTRPRGGF
jgi:hypothetical protein